MFTLGTGVGGGLILNGNIWRGMTGMAGELGHVTVEPEGVPCGCGNRGCLVQYSSATAIDRMAREAVARGGAAQLGAMTDNPEFSSKIVYQLALQGDDQAREIFRRVGHALRIAVADMVRLAFCESAQRAGAVGNPLPSPRYSGERGRG